MLERVRQVLFDEPTPRRPLHLLPGVVIVGLQWLLWYVLPAVAPGEDAMVVGSLGGMALGLGVLVWWAFFSRAPRPERWGAALLMIVALVATPAIIHESIATAHMGLMFPLYAIPTLSLAFVVWAAATRRLPDKLRRATMVATILMACGGWALVRCDGITGHSGALFAWRWAETDEERFLSQLDEEPTAPPPAATAKTDADWPGFRGPNRDGVARGVRIGTDWSASPPAEMWRRPIGPGCSSFAVRGELVYTQEQRGDDEAVTCYYLETGKPAWIHRDEARFWDSHAGAGPRSTPTVSEGRVYALGGTGILNALDARDGSVVWSRNAASDANLNALDARDDSVVWSRNAATDTGTKAPTWGFTSSPLVLDDLVIVAVEGTVAAYDRATGEPRWTGPNGGSSYSSPHLMTIDGVAQVLHMSNVGATSFAPADGTVLWRHEWPGEDRCVQPAMTADGDLLLCGGGLKLGMRRFAVTRASDGWKVEERWESRGLRPNHNDSVVHEGHVYGFSGPRLVCIDVGEGKRKWRDARYAGFTILLADQGLLLVLSEKGEVALVEATPGKFTELARIQAIEGKTWNVPALAGDILLVRNAREMAAFRLPSADR
ncbi:MAG: outer membrane protein assembly factor BamB family protein [Planctomycetota bacterium]